ncbi:MAG: helix-turn-helix domain-containing protein [Candidatus Berkelbacteria bacterium]|nr:helix-turn-helix domain-containing protein [Candidatus Berkelbacteria bacterium]
MANKKIENLAETLKDLGLSDNEARVYLASLSIGPAPILDLARIAEIKRTTVYSVVEYLESKGLMRIEIKSGRRVFVAEHPNKLQSMLKLKEDNLAQLLPDFLELYDLKKNEGFIKYYQGIEAIKNVYNGLILDIKPDDDYLIISKYDDWHELDPKFFTNFWERRAKIDIKIRILLQDTSEARQLKNREHRTNHQIKLLPGDTELITNLVITPQKVVTHQLTTPIFALVVENQSIIQMNKEMFEIMWRSIP